VVLGLARSGRAAQAALERRGVEVRAADRTLGNDSELGLLDGAGLLVKSPGVPGEAALVVAARERGVPVWSEIELGYRLLGARLVAVTGTNGKTTTSELLGAMLGAPVAGNVGRALTELDGAVDAGALVVCEVSSFQLEDVHEFRPSVAVLLNLEADHLDRHGSFEAYRDAKLRLFEKQRPEDTAVVPRGLAAVPGAARRVEFRWDDRLPAEPLIPGQHNRENAAAATAAARAVGASDEQVAEALRTFPGVPHRLEPVRELHGVLFVNDSKATNVAAARRGVAAYADRPLRLIVGGSRKGEDFAPLAAALGPNVRAVYAIGETAGELLAAIPTALGAHDLSTAVRRAAADAEPGDVVLLSPACASFDQFHDYEDRGDSFRRLVQSLE
jgi:UDP-N-acetylmuramoylalanine--D-glutamate ligase